MSFWCHISGKLVSFQCQFGVNLVSIWYHFGVILVSFWCHFGVISSCHVIRLIFCLNQAISADECSEECPTGQQLTSLSNNATCEQCAKGTYRTKGREMACLSCPQGFTTSRTGSATVDECSEPKCPPGSSLSPDNICVSCPIGTYQVQLNFKNSNWFKFHSNSLELNIF